MVEDSTRDEVATGLQGVAHDEFARGPRSQGGGRRKGAESETLGGALVGGGVWWNARLVHSTTSPCVGATTF
ncbi:hypothetical protein TIFTF001_001821 [Ficus carica]|uniref:Uncharacterized protein n=1 Tax=Ficus carica TaxID=3494 RepID=A0AA87ZJV2_FICCA|nr:hypothetical protein TIFTF001_001821 [Ficus carica]